MPAGYKKAKQRASPRRPVPDLGVDPRLILNPAYRQYFGKEGSEPFTVYGLLLRTLCNMFYGPELRAIQKQEGANSQTRPQPKKVIRVEEWDKYFKRAIHDQVKTGQKRVTLDNVPVGDELPEGHIIRISGTGRTAITSYKEAGQRARMEMMLSLMEEHLDDLYRSAKKT